MSYVIYRGTWLHDLGGLAFSYILDIPFERLDGGYTTEFRIGMVFFTWCIIKLDCYVTLCISSHILIVANNISHMGIKMISWILIVGVVTNISDSYDHI